MYLLISHILYPEYLFPPFKCASPSPHQIHLSSISLQRRAGLPEGEWFQKQRSQRQPQLHLSGVPQERPTTQPYVYAEDLVQTLIGALVVTSFSVSPYEPYLVDSVVCIFVVSSTTLVPVYSTKCVNSLVETKLWARNFS